MSSAIILTRRESRILEAKEALMQVEKSLSEIDFNKLCQKTFHPSPSNWEDQVLYFLMVDRFSDGNEKDYIGNGGEIITTGQTPKFKSTDKGNADKNIWTEAGSGWNGGTLKGLSSKMGYLKRLGVTGLWLSPIFKQFYNPRDEKHQYGWNYHGYAIQNYLAIDPNFGTREDLQEMVQIAHKHGIYVILDIVLNHTGRVFEYDLYSTPWDYCNGQKFQPFAWNDKDNKPTIPFGKLNSGEHPDQYPDGLIWPEEFQNPDFYTQKGRITGGGWDSFPQYCEGDFNEYMMDINLGYGDVFNYKASSALKALCEVYKFWIAYADIDGYRIDTIKHMDKGAVKYLANEIHEFAQSIGKENFYLLGEIAPVGNDELKTICNINDNACQHSLSEAVAAFYVMSATGLNASLALRWTQDATQDIVKGYLEPESYFNMFRNSDDENLTSHHWIKDKLIIMTDDHDKIGQDPKHRFGADVYGQKDNKMLSLNLIAFNSLTLGIPCIYYGTEQQFDGKGDSDKYIRESMFGGQFGAFESQNVHFFDEENYVYKEVAKIHQLRSQKIALRRGRQYLRPISGDGINFSYPKKLGDAPLKTIIAWSRIFNNQEILVAINTDRYYPSKAWIIIDVDLHASKVMKCIYSSNPDQIGSSVQIEQKNGSAVQIEVPPAGVVIFE